jgi:hypothetical protein
MKELIVFLKKHRACKKFNKNFIDAYRSREDLKDFCIRRSQEDYFDVAFIWANTKEGHDFWDDLNIKWKESL